MFPLQLHYVIQFHLQELLRLSATDYEWFLFVYNERAAGFLFVYFYCVYHFSKRVVRQQIIPE